MSELIQEFTAAVPDGAGKLYTARVRGDTDSVGHWQGWLEFLPRDGGLALQTGRETTQSTREHLRYWASGLSPTYLGSALRRAQRTQSADPPAPPPLEDPRFDAALIRGEHPDSAVIEMELETLDPAVPLRGRWRAYVRPRSPLRRGRRARPRRRHGAQRGRRGRAGDVRVRGARGRRRSRRPAARRLSATSRPSRSGRAQRPRWGRPRSRGAGCGSRSG